VRFCTTIFRADLFDEAVIHPADVFNQK